MIRPSAPASTWTVGLCAALSAIGILLVWWLDSTIRTEPGQEEVLWSLMTRPLTGVAMDRKYASATSDAATGANPGNAGWYATDSASTVGLTQLIRMPRGSSNAAARTNPSTV